MSQNPSALVRLWEEFSKREPDAVLSGIYANKPGYHNTRENHLRYRPDDYSIQDPLDRRGPSDKAAAIDITFRSAQAGNFKTIAKYCGRIDAAMRKRDKRLFHDGKPVVREWFGNDDNDRQVEGYSMYRGRFMSSDPSHIWHLHISFHRWCVENWDAVKGVLEVLLGQDTEDDPLAGITLNDIRKVVREEINDHDKKVIGKYASGTPILFGSAGGARYAHLSYLTDKEILEVLSGVAKMVGGGLAEADRKALAAEIAARVDRLRVVIDREEVEE